MLSEYRINLQKNPDFTLAPCALPAESFNNEPRTSYQRRNSGAIFCLCTVGNSNWMACICELQRTGEKGEEGSCLEKGVVRLVCCA